MGESGKYHLRCELRSHLEDVRCVCITDGGLATGSRDKTIKMWTDQGPAGFALTSTFVGHTDYVSALTFTSPGPSCPLPGGALVSGSRDTTVAVWDLTTASAAQELKGHQYQVAAVAVAPTGDIISASLDKTLRIWRGGKCSSVLEGHSAAVLSLAVLPDGATIASGSGDCTVKIWSLADGTCTATIKAHEDSVRGMALLPGVGLVTGSHDATLKVWTLAGENIAEMVGHTGLVYCVACSQDSTLVGSGSEDNTAKIWSPDGQCLQTLEHPGCIWGVAFLPNGDFVTACSDGVARVWSRDPQLCAPADVVEAYNASVVAFKEAAAAKDGSGGGDGAAGGGLPAGLTVEDASVLQTPGTRDGQTKIVAEGSGAAAYSWDAANGQWERIGDVMGGPDDGGTGGGGGGGGGRKWHLGRQWDYVFDVDISDDAPPLKLAMDAEDNPYIVADRFLEEYELSPGYKEQIVEFILQNTQQGRANAAPLGTYVDPYTGASAYVPPSGGGQQQSQSPAQGGGGGAAAAAGGYAVTGGGADPFTGGGGGGSVRHVPAPALLLFDASPPVEGLRKKMIEFNTELAAVEGTAGLALSDTEVGDGGPLHSLLTAVGAPAGARSFDTAAVAALLPRLLSWPAPQLFPALDVARVAVLDAEVAQGLANQAGAISVDAPLGSLGRALAVACSSSPPVPASQQVALRCACNLFAQVPLATWARDNLLGLLQGLCAPCASSPAKGVRLGVATLLVNAAIMLTKLPGDELQSKAAVVETAGALLMACAPEDEEPRYRALVALGTVLPEHSQVRMIAREVGLLSVVGDLQRVPGKVGEVAREVSGLMRL